MGQGAASDLDLSWHRASGLPGSVNSFNLLGLYSPLLAALNIAL